MSDYSRRWRSGDAAAAQAALLDQTQLSELSLTAQALPDTLFEFKRPSSHPLIGETTSLHRGRGYEVEESREYQAGDEPRLLNWRMYARTGDLYTKVFSEERRPQVFLVVDRRASMRFATCHQLKAALAARIAACYAYQGVQQAVAVGGLVLNQSEQWFGSAMGEEALHGFLQCISGPCAPLDFEEDQPDLGESLRLLLYRLPAGCFVLLLSDFSDLDPQLHLAELQQLAQRHNVRAVQILDPVEQQLPAHDLLFEDAHAAQPLFIDGRDEALQSRYKQVFEERQSKFKECFRSCHIPLTTCTTADELTACLGAG